MFTPHQENYSDRLQRLIDIAQKEQWSPAEKIDWSLEVKIPQEINDKTYIDMVSQLYYAEEATIHIIGQLLQKVPDFQARQYLCTQAMDEARHTHVYRKYLEKLGDIAPINEGLRIVLESGLNWQGTFCGTIVALNVVMEGEAVNQQTKRIDTLPCPLFQQINRSIIQDEYRHSAFGRLYMKDKLPDVGSEEKQAIFNWVKKLWVLWAGANEGRYAIDGADILRTEKHELDSRWQQQAHILNQIGLA